MDRHIRQPSTLPIPLKKKDTPTDITDTLSQKTSKNLFRKSLVDDLVDDFYSNIIDWHNNSIFYASINTLKKYDYNSTLSLSITSIPSICINALRVNPNCTDICMGNSNGTLVFHNLETGKEQSFNQHKSRIGIIEWISNNVMCSGARDRLIKVMDLRSKGDYMSISKHTQEICGLSVSCDKILLASGGNDNKLMVHDLRFLETPLNVFNDHKAAVKAIAWSPSNRNLMVSGGGTADKCIKMWDVGRIIGNCGTKVKSNGRIHRRQSENNFDIELREINRNDELYKTKSNGKEIFNEDSSLKSLLDELNYYSQQNVNLVDKNNYISNSADRIEILRIQNCILRTNLESNQIIEDNLDDSESQKLSLNSNLNVKENCLVKSIHGGSQICNLYWTSNNEIISTTGYSNHDIRIYNENLKLKEKMYGHRSRVIHFAMAKDEKKFVTASTSPEFYFWKLGEFGDNGCGRL